MNVKNKEIISINSNNPMWQCSGNCNNINDLYARICVPDVIKDLNVKEFNLMTRTNETGFIEWHEKCKCICRLNKIICNKQNGIEMNVKN